jgi:predicted kinase
MIMLVIMAGLPGSGKSTVATRLARELPALVLDKDVVRAGLFPPQEIEYSTRQDDFVVSVMLQMARFYFEKDPQRTLILDGRPYAQRYQIEQVTRFAAEIGQIAKLIVCTCSDEIVRSRLERSVASGRHMAANRNFDLYRRMKAAQEPFEFPHLLVDTSQPLQACVQECITYIQRL